MVSLIIAIVIKQVYKKTDHITIIIHLCHSTTAIIITATMSFAIRSRHFHLALRAYVHEQAQARHRLSSFASQVVGFGSLTQAK